MILRGGREQMSLGTERLVGTRYGPNVPLAYDGGRVIVRPPDDVLFLPEDNLHAPNESFNLDVMKKGIETSRRILAAIAQK